MTEVKTKSASEGIWGPKVEIATFAATTKCWSAPVGGQTIAEIVDRLQEPGIDDAEFLKLVCALYDSGYAAGWNAHVSAMVRRS